MENEIGSDMKKTESNTAAAGYIRRMNEKGGMETFL